MPSAPFVIFWTVIGVLGAASIFGWPFDWPDMSEIITYRPNWWALIILLALLVLPSFIARWVSGTAGSAPETASSDDESEAGQPDTAKPTKAPIRTRIRVFGYKLKAFVIIAILVLRKNVWPIGPYEWRMGIAFALFGAVLLWAIPPVISSPQQWQAAIGAVIGFFGLGGAALFNAHLNRKRDEWLRKKKADDIRVGIISELDQISGVLMDDVLDVKPTKTPLRFHGINDNNTEFNKKIVYANNIVQLTRTDIYDSIKNNITLLTHYECIEIINVYSEIYKFIEETSQEIEKYRNDRYYRDNNIPYFTTNEFFLEAQGIRNKIRFLVKVMNDNSYTKTAPLADTLYYIFKFE